MCNYNYQIVCKQIIVHLLLPVGGENSVYQERIEG